MRSMWRWEGKSLSKWAGRKNCRCRSSPRRVCGGEGGKGRGEEGEGEDEEGRKEREKRRRTKGGRERKGEGEEEGEERKRIILPTRKVK